MPYLADLMANTSLNIPQLMLRNPWMCCWCIESKEVPKDAPRYPDSASCIEDDSPSIMGDNKSADWIGKADSKTEPCI